MHFSFLHLLLGASTLAGSAFATPVASVTSRQATQALEGYVFVYFTGNTIEGEKIYLAASQGNNALRYDTLNGAKPILASTEGTKGLRDPFLIRHPHTGTIYLLATDLSIGSGTSWPDSGKFGSRHLEIWETNDLINWSQQRHTLVSPPTVGNTWAPEALWDEVRQAFVVYWASAIYAEGDVNRTVNQPHRMLTSITTDFRTFTTPEIWQDEGVALIDTTVIFDNETYHRVTKDQDNSRACRARDNFQQKSTDLLAPFDEWNSVSDCIGSKAGLEPSEGGFLFKSNPGDVNGEKYYLFLDEYVRRGYVPLETTDLNRPNWKLSSSWRFAPIMRHGGVLAVTGAELESVRAHYGAGSS